MQQQQGNMFLYRVEISKGEHQIYVTDPSHRILGQVSELNLEPTNETLVTLGGGNIEPNRLIDPGTQIRRLRTIAEDYQLVASGGTIISSVQVPYGKFDGVVQQYVIEAITYNSQVDSIQKEAKRKIAELGKEPSLEERLQNFF